MGTALEHVAHISDVGSVPVAETADRREGGAAIEHAVHTSDVGSVQLRDVDCDEVRVSAASPAAKPIGCANRLDAVIYHSSGFYLGCLVFPLRILRCLLLLDPRVNGCSRLAVERIAGRGHTCTFVEIETVIVSGVDGVCGFLWCDVICRSSFYILCCRAVFIECFTKDFLTNLIGSNGISMSGCISNGRFVT